ncbi:Aldo/keto reductase [Atractiella rhizophila]|nr:Aldo/keto reductase [Atractiella rhizophila]
MTSSNPVRQLGKNGPRIPALGFGAMGLSAFYGQLKPEEESKALLKKVLDLGVQHIDTAILYGAGKNESLIGTVLSDPEYRKKCFIATKFGAMYDPEGKMYLSGKPEVVRQWCEDSLKRLQVDSIDLYYQHRVDRNIPIEETWKELAALQKEGKIKHLGISEATADEIRKAHAVAPISALQIEFSLWTPDIRTNGILDTCRELGIAIVAYSPLGRGFLTGAYKPEDFKQGDFRSINPRFQKEAFDENMKLVNAVKEIATKKNCSAGQLALAWVLAQGDDFFAIPGTKNEKYLLENVGSTEVKLSAEDLKEIDAIVEKIKVVGMRYPAPSNVVGTAF